MARMIMKNKKSYSKKAGLPPGKPIFVGEQKVEKPNINVIKYNDTIVKEFNVKNTEEIVGLVSDDTVTWIGVHGLHNVELIQDVCSIFSIHPLVQEDIVHLDQRPKVEDLNDYIFIILRMFYFENNNLADEQVSIILGKNYVITFQEKPTDIFEPLKERIRSKKFRVNKQGADYLAYSLIDAIVDNYFVIIETLGDDVEAVEDMLLDNPTNNLLEQIHVLKRHMISIRRSVWPLRELVSKFERMESQLIQESTIIYIRDVYDHTIQIIDSIENYRDILSGMLDTYLSSISYKMNDIMKTLTIMSTIFIPLTFIVGVYGMNFEYMPELKWKLGYLGVWIVMISISFGLFFFFRKKKWL
jgi:magnesium transporter